MDACQQRGSSLRLGTDQLRYGAGETVKVLARFLDEKHNGIDGLDPRFMVRAPNMGARVSVFDAKKRPDSNGLYEVEIHGCTAPGLYEVSLDCPKAQELLGRRYPADGLMNAGLPVPLEMGEYRAYRWELHLV